MLGETRTVGQPKSQSKRHTEKMRPFSAAVFRVLISLRTKFAILKSNLLKGVGNMNKPMFTKTLFLSLVAGLVAVFLVSLSTPASAEEFEGELVDLTCYLSAVDKATGEAHKQCGLKCVKEGHQPMGLLTKDGNLYVVAISHEDATLFSALADKVNTQVKVMGKPLEQKGLKGIEVQKIE
jgi:hypothetical protein